MSVKNTLTFFLLIYLEPVPEKTLPIFNSPPLHFCIVKFGFKFSFPIQLLGECGPMKRIHVILNESGSGSYWK